MDKIIEYAEAINLGLCYAQEAGDNPNALFIRDRESNMIIDRLTIEREINLLLELTQDKEDKLMSYYK
jgi:hypothetical protein